MIAQGYPVAPSLYLFQYALNLNRHGEQCLANSGAICA
jgi:hypothetical protein